MKLEPPENAVPPSPLDKAQPIAQNVAYPTSRSNKFLASMLTVFLDLKRKPPNTFQLLGYIKVHKIENVKTCLYKYSIYIHLTAPASSRANPACMRKTSIPRDIRKNASIFFFKQSKSQLVSFCNNNCIHRREKY